MSETSVWRNRDFVVLWTGRLVSTLGSGISAIALPLLVLAVTRSPAKAGVVAAVSGAPYFLLSVPAGVAADRWNRRAILVAGDAGRALAWTAVGVAALAKHVSLPLLVVAGACEGSFFVFHNVAMSAVVPRVVTSDQLPAAVAQNAVILGTSDLLGPAIGGALFQAGRAVPFLTDAASYFASIFSVAAIGTSLDAPLASERGSVLAEARDGYRFLRGQPALRTITLVGGIGDVLFAGIALVLIVTSQRRAHASAAGIGGGLRRFVRRRTARRARGAACPREIGRGRDVRRLRCRRRSRLPAIDGGEERRRHRRDLGTLGIMAAGRIVLEIWLVATPAVRRAGVPPRAAA